MNESALTLNETRRLPWWRTVPLAALRWMPWRRGKMRAVRLILGGSQSERNVFITASGGLKVVLPSLADPISQELLAFGRYESSVARFIRNSVKFGGNCVDVGANIGLMTWELSHAVGPNGRVLSVEASPEIFKRLSQTVSLNQLANVEAVNVAAHEHDDIHLPFWTAPLEKSGMGSLASQFREEPITVQGHTLDSLVANRQMGPIDLLKVDVEGFEASVFRGARRLLTARPAPIVVFEFLRWAESRAGFEPGEAQKVLRDCGYRLHVLDDYGKIGRVMTEVMTEGGAMLVGYPS